MVALDLETSDFSGSVMMPDAKTVGYRQRETTICISVELGSIKGSCVSRAFRRRIMVVDPGSDVTKS